MKLFDIYYEKKHTHINIYNFMLILFEFTAMNLQPELKLLNTRKRKKNSH